MRCSVTSLPSAVGRIGAYALTDGTLLCAPQPACKGFDNAVAENPGLRQGVNIRQDKVTNPAVAATFGFDCAAD